MRKIISVTEKAQLNDKGVYCFYKTVFFLGLKLYEYTFESTKKEYVNEYKHCENIGFSAK